MTKTESALAMVKAVADAIRELGTVPSGHLYTQLMGHIDITTYNGIINILQKAGLISIKSDLITWEIKQ